MATFTERKYQGKVAGLQWQATVRMKDRVTGIMHRKSRTYETLQAAQDWARDLEAALRKGGYHDTDLIDSTPLKIIIQRYIDEVSPTKLGSEQEIVRLKAWLRHGLAARPLSRCLPKDFADYIAVRRKDTSKRGGTVAEQTIKHEIIVISNVFETARKDWGYDLPNPIKSISKPRGSGTRETRIPPADWIKLEAELKKCRNPHFAVIAEVAIETGMRQDEIMRMTWADIDLSKRMVTVMGKDTSSPGQRKKRTVPISMCAGALLSSMPRSIKSESCVFAGSSADGLSRAFTKAAKDAGLKGVVFHSTRHEAASRLAPHYPMVTLMKIFGWKTPVMAARYYHASEEELLAGLDRKANA